MKSLRIFSAECTGILFVILLLSSCQEKIFDPGDNDLKVSRQNPAPVAMIENFMVITKSETLPSGFESKMKAYGDVVNSIPEIGVVVVKPSVTGFAAKVAKLAEVQAVVPDLKMRWVEPVKSFPAANPPSTGDSEPYFTLQWGLDAINAPEAWNAGYMGDNARVFILDNGIDAEHPDIAPNLNTSLCTSIVPGEDFNFNDPAEFAHGTHVAGIVAAADNDLGTIGVAPEAELVAVKVLSEKTGSGLFSWINEGIVYAASEGADVINMSLGAIVNKNGFYLDENGDIQKVPGIYIVSLILTTQRAVNYAHKMGSVVVASAGNENANFDGLASYMVIPAELQNVIAVSATAPFEWYYNPDTYLDNPASYSNIGRSLVEVAAPGGDFLSEKFYWYYDMVLSTVKGGYAWAAGTSMSAPHVSAVAALIKSANPDMTPDEVTKQLLKTADPLDGNGASVYYGKGRVNAYRAVTE